MAGNDTSEVLSRCYLFNNATPDVWGDCCEDLSIVPKPIWVVFLLSVPIEAVLAGADVRATAGMYEEKSNQTAVIFLLYNFVTLGLLAYQFDWGSCEASVEGVWECYQGLLFMFYNSTAALASMTLWMLIIMRKYYPQLYFVTRLVISPRFLWRWFDRLNLKNGGTHATVERWHMISTSTKLFWYNKVGIVTTLLFGGITHIIPMFFAYPYVLFTMCIALIYSHSIRLGYTGLKNTTNLWSTVWNVLVFYPFSLVVSTVFLALSPLSLVLKFCGFHPMDRKDESLPMVNPEDANVMEIFFKTEGGGLITLEFDKEETVVAVLPKVQDNLGFDFIKRTIHLKFNGEQLEESETVTLAEYGIKSGDVLEIIVDPEKIEIRVKLENGDILVIKMDSQAAVEVLMGELAKQTGIAPEEQFLLKDGQRLKTSVKLISLGLTEKQELELFPVEMQVQVTLSDGEVTQITVRRDDLGAELIATVASMEGTSEEYIHLSFNGTDINSEAMLHAQGLRTDTQLITVREVDVEVFRDDAANLTFRLDINTTIRELSERLVQESGIAIEDQYLLHLSETLPEDSTLRDLDYLRFKLFNVNLPLSISLSNDTVEQVNVRRDNSLAELKRVVASKEGTSEDLVHLYRNGEELFRNEMTLHSLMLSPGEELKCTVDVVIEVNLPDSKKLRVILNSRESALQVKKKWQEESQIDPSQMLLFVNGELVDDTDEVGAVAEEGELTLMNREVTLRLTETAGGPGVDLPFPLDGTFGELLERVAPMRGATTPDALRLFFPRLDVGTTGEASRVPDLNVPLYELGVEDGEEVVAFYPVQKHAQLLASQSFARRKSTKKDKEMVGTTTKVAKRPRPQRRRAAAVPTPQPPKPRPQASSSAKRLSMRVGPPTGGKRASARYGLAVPQLPTSRTTARASLRFGGEDDGRELGGRAPETEVKERYKAPEQELERRIEEVVEDGIIEGVVEKDAKKEERRERRRERRRRVLAYVKDILRNLCMFDPNGKVIMFAAATTFLCFTFSANYGLILYSGAPYLKVLELDWNSRDSLQWFQCTADNFADFRAFGLIDFLGLAIGTAAGLIEFADFLVSI